MQARAMLDSGLSEEGMVNQEFEELYPGKVQRTQIAYNSKVILNMFCDMLNSALLNWKALEASWLLDSAFADACMCLSSEAQSM